MAGKARAWNCPTARGIALPSEITRCLLRVGSSATALAAPPQAPREFPRHGGRRGAEAVLCFNNLSTGRWHRVTGRPWRVMPPTNSFAELCEMAHSKKKLRLLCSVTDLQAKS